MTFTLRSVLTEVPPHQRLLLDLADRLFILRSLGTSLSREMALLELQLRECAQNSSPPTPDVVNQLVESVRTLRCQGTEISADLALLELNMREVNQATTQQSVSLPKTSPPNVLKDFYAWVKNHPLPEDIDPNDLESFLEDGYRHFFALLVLNQASFQPVFLNHTTAVNVEQLIRRIVHRAKRCAVLHGWVVDAIQTHKSGNEIATLMIRRDAAFSRFLDRLHEIRLLAQTLSSGKALLH